MLVDGVIGFVRYRDGTYGTDEREYRLYASLAQAKDEKKPSDVVKIYTGRVQ
jgi:hypothetical protein